MHEVDNIRIHGISASLKVRQKEIMSFLGGTIRNIYLHMKYSNKIL